MDSTDVVYTFAGCKLLPGKRQLIRSGTEIEVQAQVFDLLHYLVSHPGRVIDKDTLLDQVWHNAHLSDATISQAIRKARKAVGDDGNAQKIIRTVHGKGFMLAEDCNVECSPLNGAHQSAFSRSKWIWVTVALILAGLIATAIVMRASRDHATEAETVDIVLPAMAVFPFANQTGDADKAWFELGLAEAVAILLEDSQLFSVRHPGDLKAVPQLPLENRALSVGAEYALETKIGVDQEQLQVSYTLYRKHAQRLQGTFLVADATVAARMLVTRILDSVQQAPAVPVAEQPQLHDPLALELYGQGMEAIYRGHNDKAVAFLSAAQARLPDSAAITVAMAIAQFDQSAVQSSLQQYRNVRAQLPPEAILERARLGYEIGTELWFNGSVDEAGAVLKGVLDDARKNPFLHAMVLNSLSMVLHSQLRFQESWEMARQAELMSAELNDPYHESMVLGNLGYMAEDQGRLSQASDFHRRALNIREQFDFPVLIAASQYALARIERRSGAFAIAQQLLEASLATVREHQLPFDEFDNLEELAEVYMRLQQFDLAEQTLEQAQAIAEQNDDQLGLAWSRQVMGRLALRRGQMTATDIERQQEAANALTSLGEDQDAFTAQLELADMFILKEDSAAAVKVLHKLQTSSELESPVLELRTRFLEARLGDEEDIFTKVLDLIGQARAIGVLDLEAEYAIYAGHLALQQKDLNSARRMLVIASSWSDSYYRTQQLGEAILKASAPRR